MGESASVPIPVWIKFFSEQESVVKLHKKRGETVIQALEEWNREELISSDLDEFVHLNLCNCTYKLLRRV